MEQLDQSKNTNDNIDRSQMSPKVKRWIIIGISIVLILIMIRVFSSWYQNHAKKPKTASIAVLSSVIQNKDMPVYVSALGNVSSYLSITVKTQINGQLIRVFFTEGQAVKKGDVLAEIDPRPYEAQLLQFQGQLARDQAILDNALIDMKRYETLLKEDSVSQQTLETQKALVRQYQGIIQLDQGQIDQVKINLIYCRITSPVDGRVGLRLVDPGNYVQVTDTTGIVVLNTIQPISVLFAIAEDLLPPVLQKIRNGEILRAEAYDRSQNKLLTLGSVSTVDNQIDPSTGTVKLRGIFPNENNVLFPNQFVNIKLLVNTLKNSMAIPTAAVQQGNKGAFVYLLKKELPANTQVNKNHAAKNKDNDNDSKKLIYRVFIKPVKVLATNENESAIEGDLLPGQLVVTEGGDKLTDNSLVHTVNEQTNLAPLSTSEGGKEALKNDTKKEVNQEKQSIQDIYTKPRMRAVHKEDIKASKYFLLDIDRKFRDLDFRDSSHFYYTKLMHDYHFIYGDKTYNYPEKYE